MIYTNGVKGKMSFNTIISQLVTDSSIDKVRLPAEPTALSRFRDAANDILNKAVFELGEQADSDYFQCSRERYLVLLALAKQYFPNKAKVLDVGNAPGHLAIMLDACDFSVTGVNVTKEWDSTYPSAKWLDVFSVTICDVEKNLLPFPDQSFDAIVFTEVLEHIAITHPKNILKDFKRVLKPGGVNCPNLGPPVANNFGMTSVG